MQSSLKSDAVQTDYAKIIRDIEGLPWCALVTTGRVGSDFFQSLLDSHPELFVFNSVFFFHEFWRRAYSANYPAGIDIGDLADEFIGHFIYKLKSKYDYQEGKDRLGENRDKSIDIDIGVFRTTLIGLLKQRSVSSKHFLQCVYAAYALCLGQDIAKKKLFIHHIHHIWKLDDYLNDFPKSKIISMTRDPRAAFVSGVEHWFRYSPATDYTPWRIFVTIERIFKDAMELEKYPNEFRVLRLEDLGSEEVLRQVCAWLGVSYHPLMRQSTWGGLRWHGDRLSVARPGANEGGFSKSMTYNKWEVKLTMTDKYLLDFLLSERLRHYGYAYKRYSGFHHYLIAFLAVLLPSTYERHFLSPGYLGSQLLSKNWRNIFKVYYYYLKRVALYYGLYFKKLTGQRHDLAIFRAGP